MSKPKTTKKTRRRGGPLDFVYKTPEELYEIERNGPSKHSTLEQLRESAKSNNMCYVCGSMPAWKYVGLGLCFTCTTGESDASEDYEVRA